MADAAIPEADQADVQEQAEEVEPAAPAGRLADAGHLDRPLDADEADVIEQRLEVPLDDEER
jgi:hypothetical protein